MTTPVDLLDIARAIQVSMPDETGQRTCINRAYYAIFHTANEIDERLHLPIAPVTAKGSSHKKLYDRLINCLPSNSAEWIKVKSLGYTASKVLKPYRELADYRLYDPIPNEMPADAIAKAANLIEKAATI